MAAKFLNDLLVSTGRFRPGKTGQASCRDSREVEPMPPGDDAADRQDLDHLLQKEERHARRDAERRQIAEAAKRRDELLRILEETAEHLHAQQQFLADRIAVIEDAGNELRQLPEEIAVDDLSQARQRLRTAQMELTKLSRYVEGAAATRYPAEMDSSFKSLTKLGLALTWPLLVLLALGVCLVLAALYSLFGA